MSQIFVLVAFASFLVASVLGTWVKDYQSATVNAILTLACAVLFERQRGPK